MWTLAVNRNQDLLGKTMLVLRRSCTAVIEIDSEEWTSLHNELRRIVAARQKLLEPDQFNFAFLMNRDAQVHLHVVPRYAAARRWHDRDFTDAHWAAPFGHEQRVLEAHDVKTLAGEIRTALQAAL